MKPLTVDDLDTMITTAMAADDWATVDDLAPRLDRLDRPKPVPPLVSVALWYASTGLQVFPLQPGQKIPHRGTRGCKDATNDPTVITEWWARWPGSNIGIATGHLVDVIDIDGALGVESWARLEGLPPVLGVVSTPRAGGTHLYVETSGEGNAAGIFPGIDIRGVGGYVVAPPSVNLDGKAYRWRRPLALPSREAVAA